MRVIQELFKSTFRRRVTTCLFKDYVCPTGRSVADPIPVGVDDVFTFRTQAGGKYSSNVNCKINYTMANTCSQLRLKCEKFVVVRGDFLAITKPTSDGIATKK